MRKISILTISLLIVASFSILSITPVQASISNYLWVEPFYYGYDVYFYQYSMTAYETGSTAQLQVFVHNTLNGYPNITVTAVKVWMDWDANYTSDETPYVLSYNEHRHFMINFTVPSTDIADNKMLHEYIIFVEFSYDGQENYWTYYTTRFAVYSTDQAEAENLYREISDLSNMSPFFSSSEGRTSWLHAIIEFREGYTDHKLGDFMGAKTHYQSALNLYNQAINSEADRGTTLENTLIQAFMVLSIGLAMGAILIGIGIIVYALTRRKIAPS